jgi:uncharacterized protein with GYD domain
MYMLMAKYSTAALKAIMESGSDREAAAREAIEAVGGKLHGFYGMFGQEYGLAMIVEAPGHAEYLRSIRGLMSPRHCRSQRKSARCIGRRAVDRANACQGTPGNGSGPRGGYRVVTAAS